MTFLRKTSTAFIIAIILMLGMATAALEPVHGAESETTLVLETTADAAADDLAGEGDDSQGTCGCKGTFIRTKPH